MAQRRRETAEARADTWYPLYAEMGPDRSLKALRVRMGHIGAKVPTLNTLKRWSVSFNWQERVAAFDKAQAQRALERAGDRVEIMNDRHSQFGRVMQTISGRSLAQFGVANSQKLRDMGPGDTVRMGVEGVKMERMAEGLATERHEIVMSLVRVMVQAIAALFLEVNQLADPDARAAAFVEGGDRIVRERLEDVGERTGT